MAETRLIRFADLAGRSELRDRLQRQSREGRLPPVLLFTGPPGVGKRSIAHALAAWLFCPDARAGTDDACGLCPVCRRVKAGTCSDLCVVTAGSKKEIGIERAREIRQFLSLSPAEGSERIAIIEDAERLTVAAQNALLKVLEEPPPRARIWLTASRIDAVLATVRSRCAKIPVPPLPVESVREVLETHHGLDPSTAAELATLSEGSVGRALSLTRLLEAEERAALEKLLRTLPSARYRDLLALVETMLEPESKQEGKLEYLLAYFRGQALAAATVDERKEAVRRARVVYEAWQVLHDSYPNRTLLFESMALKLVGDR